MRLFFISAGMNTMATDSVNATRKYNIELPGCFFLTRFFTNKKSNKPPVRKYNNNTCDLKKQQNVMLASKKI